jgi:DNA-binding response OmpR family regulator
VHDAELRLQGFAGADDFLLKTIDTRQLATRARAGMIAFAFPAARANLRRRDSGRHARNRRLVLR